MPAFNCVLSIFVTFYCYILKVQAQKNDLCSVYNPFKVSPDNAKFQVGGPFPLHSEDCVFIRPEVVQELVAVQWALTHWNQNPDNHDYKLAMHAGDTCSRKKETLSQAVKFLENSGFYEPVECSSYRGVTGPTLLGMVVPRDREAAQTIGDLLQSNPIPLISYSTPATEGLGTKNLLPAVSTAPSLAHYLKAVVHLMGHLRSNLVSFLVSDDHISSETVHMLQRTLKRSEITVGDTRTVYMSSSKVATDLTPIVVCFLSKRELMEIFSLPSTRSVEKLWITVPVNGEKLTTTEFKRILPHSSKANVIVLQESVTEIHEFREYFLHILRHNYQSYSLLAAYMQQVYNCTLTGKAGFPACQDLGEDYVRSVFIQAPAVENALLATYTLAALGKKLAEDPKTATVCKVPGAKCTKTIMKVLRRLEYQFDEYDPEEFYGFVLKFRNAGDTNGLHVAQSLNIEGTQVVHDHSVGLSLRKVLEYPIGSEVRILDGNFRWPSAEQPIRSLCPLHRAQCQHCPETIYADPHVSSLSMPRTYDLYLIGLFDLHQGSNCTTPLENSNFVTLPMTFAHTLWTMKQRYPKMNLLPGVSLGGYILDTCSTGNRALKAVIETSEKCMVLPYAAGNITLSPLNVMGYVFGGKRSTSSMLRQLFRKDDFGSVKPLLTVNQAEKDSFRDFSFLPSYTTQAATVIEVLKNFDWDHVSVILSDDQTACVEAYEIFTSIASTEEICIAEVIRFGEYFRDRLKSPPSTKVAISFTTAEDMALYFKTVGPESQTIFILIGDAHNWQYTDAYRRQPRAEWQRAALGSISLQPHLTGMLGSEFTDWLESITPDRFPEVWYHRFIEEKFRCKMPKRANDDINQRICTGQEILGPAPFGRLTEAGYLAFAIESLIFAIDAAYKKLCPLTQQICDAFVLNGTTEITSIMEKIAHSDSFEIYNFRIVGDQPVYAKIGNWSRDKSLRFTEPWVWYDKHSKESATIPTSTCRPPLCKCYLDGKVFHEPSEQGKFRKPVHLSQNSDLQRSKSSFRVEKMSLKSGSWKSHTWTYIFLALDSVLLLLAVGVLTLICVKLYYRVVKGNQSLGICLLFGIILLYVTGYFYIFDPSENLCKCRYFLHSFAYSICYGVLIAKATQLRNSETVGYSGYISYWNYWLLLFFIIGVQIALNFQWALVRIPAILHVIQGDEVVMRQCSWSRKEFLLSQVYVVILLVLVLFQAFMNRNIKRNYKETKWLLYTATACALVWLIWMAIYGLIPAPFQDTVIVMELITCATVILCFMFGPKLYILLSYEPVLIEYPPGYKFTNEGIENEPPNDFLGHQDPLEFTQQVDSHRTVSPGGSSAASTKSTALSQNSGTSSGEQSPVFQAVIRKKSRSKRIKAHAYTGRKEASAKQNCSDSTTKPPPFTLTPVHRKNPLHADCLEIRTVNA